MEYVCPSRIEELFDDSETVSKGRIKAVEWAQRLKLQIGDKVWLPEIGWTEKVPGIQ